MSIREEAPVSTTEAGRDRPDFSAWEGYVDAAVEFAERYNEPFSITILEALLARGPLGHDTGRHTTPEATSPFTEKVRSSESSGLERAAQEAGVPPEGLRRILHVSDEDDLEILPRIGGSSRSERANRVAAVYLFLREHMFEDFKVHIDQLREVCQKQDAYDSANFTANFRRREYILEIGGRGTKEKEYRVSQKGADLAREIIRSLTGTSDEG